MRKKSRAFFLFAYGVLPVAAAIIASGRANAQIENLCEYGGRGDHCVGNESCEGNGLATKCIEGACQIPCADEHGERTPDVCSMGETCVYGETPTQGTFYCQAGHFSVDLNLLDMCVNYFLDGAQPDLATSNQCSLERNLGALLDQDASGVFNIFDVDGCIRAFLSAPACDDEAEVCPTGLSYCEGDDECGQGLFCNMELAHCQRECGFIGSREPNGVEFLERPCFGRLTTCNYNRGQCEPVAAEDFTCQVDNDCPAGAYCLLGRCAPTCSRSVDCPGSDWVCSRTNHCEPAPSVAAPSGFTFVPRDYVVQFTSKRVALDALNDHLELPLAIMNMRTRRQELNNPGVVFGYRLEAEYNRKQHPKCDRPSNEWTSEDAADCIIDDTEQFIRLDSPFGTVSASTFPSLGITLNRAAADRLLPGYYTATLTAIYSNGGQDSATISFEKTAISGQYAGRLSIYKVHPDNLLGSNNVAMQLHVDTDTELEWDELLEQQNIVGDSDIVDITTGYLVSGFIHGNDSSVFSNPSAQNQGNNRVLVKGLYSPHLGRMRLIGVIDLPANHCVSDSGGCLGATQSSLQVRNNFGRPIRRVLHFIGPFDPQIRRFHGMYRESLSGLFNEPITLEGGFQLDQSSADETPVGVDDVLLDEANSGVVPFPSDAEISAQLNAEILSNCAGYENTDDVFVNESAFGAYLDSVTSNEPILSDLANLDELISGALSTLGGDSGAALTIHDFLQGSIEVCDAPGDIDCIDANAARCGLALHRKALLHNWVDTAALSGVGHDLFCSSTSPSADCEILPGEDDSDNALFILHEHNRFYTELFHAQKYEAGAELSDAFFSMYRAHGDDIIQAQALSQKQAALLSAWRRYGDILEQNVSPAATQALYDWPMWAFGGRGNSWLAQVKSLLEDRLEVLDELIDIKRRVLLNSTEHDFVFVDHLLHHEFLLHVYLMGLQEKWQSGSFQYDGAAVRMLEHGDILMSRVNETRNPLGLHPNQIFFENSDLQRVNWENYRQHIVSGGIGGGGLLGEVNAAIVSAISDLQASLASQNALEQKLLSGQQQFESEIDALCGPAEPLVGQIDCPILSPEEREIERECTGAGCDFQYSCEGEQCLTVVQTFNAAVSDSLKDVACRVDTPTYDVQVGSNGTPRSCVRGQMGALLQEKVQLELQRRQVYRKIGTLMRHIDAQGTYIKETQAANTALVDYIEAHNQKMLVLDGALLLANMAFEAEAASARALNCIVIVGVASGTSCAGTVAESSVTLAAIAKKFALLEPMQAAQSHLQQLKEVTMLESSQQDALRQQRMVLDNLTTEIENLIAEYELVTQQLFNLEARIADTHYLARQAARRHQETLAQVIDHLIGSESGSALRRNAKVQEANQKFQELLRVTYKMVMAFVHSYNLSAYREQLTSQVFQIVTPQGVEELIDQLDDFERDYCGSSGLDCDAANNTSYFKLSLRSTLFPDLHDMVDARTGEVLTKGEQFHNIITSSAYRQRRKRGNLMVDQIELPFAIWLNDRGEAGGAVQRWMVPPLECNHIIVGRGSGTVAVNVVGTRLTGNIHHELWRGNTDFVRGCEAEQVIPPGGGMPVSEYPTRSYIVGYAPQNALAKQDNPPTFISHTTLQPACENRQENSQGFITDESCFQYFARDRSLAAPDWRLIVPLEGGPNNEWILGDGLPAEERPIIEDIVLYVRYRTRPIE